MDEQRLIYEDGEEQARIAEIIRRDELQAERVEFLREKREIAAAKRRTARIAARKRKS